MTRVGSSGRGVDFDVVVVGARCAGAATAMLLARSGLSVLAVDRARYGTDTLSTHALTLPGVLQLSRWGLLEEIRGSGAPRVRRVVYDYNGEVFDVPVRPRGDVDGLYAPRRQVLDRVLADAAVRAGAEVRHQVRAEDLVISDGRVAGVVLGDGRTRSPVRAGLVIGADGAGSLTARRVGAEPIYTAPHSTATIYTFADGLPDDAYRNYFRPGVAVGVIPTNSGQANVWVGLRMSRLARERQGQPGRVFDRLLARAVPDLAVAVGEWTTRGRHPTFTGTRGFARRCWGPGWALVGDAGYFKDPISAHGMTDALIGAELLARQVAAMAGGVPERSALTRYARLRHQLIAPMVPAVERVAALGEDMPGLQQAHREMNAAMHAEWDLLTGLGPLPGVDPRITGDVLARVP